jgi:competence protein CoiA
MLYAMKNGTLSAPIPNDVAICPHCNMDVRAKCGSVYTWHWAHLNQCECDEWFEAESEWHRKWKRLVLPANCEVTIGNHRADIIGHNGGVVELQHSSISADDVSAREHHYGNMIWLLDGTPFQDNMIFRRKDNYISFRWKHPRKTFWFAQKPVFIDVGESFIFEIKKIHHNVPCGGWGYFRPFDWFVDKYL